MLCDISELSITKQESILNSMISTILSSQILDNNVLNNEGMIAVTTDIHGDLFSLLSSLVECGAVTVKENDFLYYNATNDKFFDKDYIYSRSQEYFENNEICVFPKPYINENFNLNYYNLGDIGDRGTESVACYALLYNIIEEYKKINKTPIHLIIGNHESSKCCNSEKTYNKYYKILKNMIENGCMSTGYIIGKENNATALWHARLHEEEIEYIFYELKTALSTENREKSIFCNILNLLIKTDEKLCGRLLEFFSNESGDNITKDNILSYFNKEELAKIKIILGDAIVNTSIEMNKKQIDDLIKINIDNKSKDFLEVSIKSRGNSPCNLLFWNDESSKGTPLLNQIVGHDAHSKTINIDNSDCSSIVNIDVMRSSGHHFNSLNNESISATSYYEVDGEGNINPLKISKQTACSTKRIFGKNISDIKFLPITNIDLLIKDKNTKELYFDMPQNDEMLKYDIEPETQDDEKLQCNVLAESQFDAAPVLNCNEKNQSDNLYKKISDSNCTVEHSILFETSDSSYIEPIQDKIKSYELIVKNELAKSVAFNLILNYNLLKKAMLHFMELNKNVNIVLDKIQYKTEKKPKDKYIIRY